METLDDFPFCLNSPATVQVIVRLIQCELGRQAMGLAEIPRK